MDACGDEWMHVAMNGCMWGDEWMHVWVNGFMWGVEWMHVGWVNGFMWREMDACGGGG